VENIPNRRQSLQGETFDGATVRFAYTIAKKLYRCPGCRLSVEIGAEHILVQYLSADPPFHQHWHRQCALTELVPELKISRVIPSS
jgi:hypothetical protein